jgi:hypothetical protein
VHIVRVASGSSRLLVVGRAREALDRGEDFADHLLQTALGHPDVLGGDSRATMGCQAVKPAGAQRIVQLGVNEGLDGPTKRFGMIAYHDVLLAPLQRVRSLLKALNPRNRRCRPHKKAAISKA